MIFTLSGILFHMMADPYIKPSELLLILTAMVSDLDISVYELYNLSIKIVLFRFHLLQIREFTEYRSLGIF